MNNRLLKVFVSGVAGLILLSLILFSCEIPNNSPGDLLDSAGKFIPDLTKELPTKAVDITRETTTKSLVLDTKYVPKPTGDLVGDDAMAAYWGGQSNGDMEWHSRVMLQDVRNLGELIINTLDSSGLALPSPGDETVSLTLDTIEFMNVTYTGLTVSLTAVDDYLLTEIFTDESTQIIRYIAVPDPDGTVTKGFFVWVNATEYTLSHSDNPSEHAKEVVEVKFDLTDPDNKLLRVDTVQWHNANNYFYGFVLKSTFDDSTHIGTGQYVDIVPDGSQNFMIKYNLDTGIKCVGYYNESSHAITQTKQFGTDNQPTTNSCSLTVADLGFTPLESSSDAPVPYTFDNVNNRINQIIGDWAGYVNRNTVDF